MNRRVQLGLAAVIAVVLGAGIAAAVIRSGEEAPRRAAAPTTSAPTTAPATTAPATSAPTTTVPAATTTTAPTATTAPPSGLATKGAGEVAVGPTTPPTGIESGLIPGLALAGAGLALWRARGQRRIS